MPPGCFAYRLAGQTLVSDVPLTLASAYATEAPEYGRHPHDGLPVEPDAPEAQAEGWLAGAIRRVVCRAGRGGFELSVPGVARFWVGRSGQALACVAADGAVAPALREEVLLGPPLTLALALGGVWCLHASALLGAGGLILLFGASGQGKSTLAAHCYLAPGGLRRVADDILPWALSDGRHLARPQFPQLKLAAGDQYPLGAAESVPIAALVLLAPTSGGTEIALRALPRLATLKALAEQTVAVSLFDRGLHQVHLSDLATLVGTVPAYRLHYPHDYARLPEVYRALADL